ncbi:MAG: HipA domain-containing protein [Oscillospiraceae bacterium]|nr:HipA domain-containing protein [Oscillospiraceae bacterium]
MMTDFTDCQIIPGRAYNGANGNKIAVRYNGVIYMLKFPPSAEGKPTELSYTNGCVSEHIASSIFNLLGIPAQETMLGTYSVRGKEKLVCACKDFTTGSKRFFDFCSIKNTVLESDSNGSGTELSDVMDAIERQKYISPSDLKEHFWDVFIADALLGNFDRHNGNWGFLYDEETDSASIAPVFDCGSCLLPQADDAVMRKVLSEEAELHARIFQFPTSALKLNGRKINYYDFITKGADSDCNAALERIFPRIDLQTIDLFIEHVEGVSDLAKEFYKTYIMARYNLILLPGYTRITIPV